MSTLPSSGGANGETMHEAPAWRGGTIFAIALHAGLAAAIVFAHFSRSAAPDTTAAITIDLAPMVSAPPEPEKAVPEGPKEEEVVEPEPVPVPEPPLPRDAILEPEKKPEPEKKKVKEETAPRAVEAPKAEAVTAPVNAPPSMAEQNAIPTYQQALLAHLERYKKYPRSARRRAQEGTAYVRFRIDRQGNVLSSVLERSSGYTLLDEETLGTVERADPLPAMPPEISGATLEVMVPVRFFLD